MDLNNPSIREEFVTHVINLLPPDQRTNISRKFITEFHYDHK